ncbi:MAG: S41 family peptidase [Longimicrobiales bacterium]|nr:S41 family peptidase [Longimicrobiales bacterium]
MRIPTARARLALIPALAGALSAGTFPEEGLHAGRIAAGTLPAAAQVPARPAPVAVAKPDPLPSFSQPAASPDGRRVAFVSGGDIWVVDAAGGGARLLVAHPAEDTRPLFSPDGRYLAFESDREGGDADIHVLELETGVVRRLTFYDDSESLDAWSRDARFLYFTSSRRDPGGQSDVYRIPVAGGTPVPVTDDRYAAEYHAAPSPDGERLAVVAGGRMALGQWWRRGSSHIDETAIWLREGGEEARYRRIVEGGKNLWPRWSPDGDALVFMSDRGGAENLWTVTAAGEALTPLTAFTDGRVLWPDLSVDGSLLVFERDFGIWALSAGGEPAPLDIRLEGAVSERVTRRLSLDRGFSDLALSPDGLKVAFIARGEVFAAGLEEAGEAVRVTRTPAAEGSVAWAPDSRRLAYVSLRSGVPALYLYDFATGEERTLTDGGDAAAGDLTPRFSPDGARVAYVRGGRELRVVELETGEDRRLADAQLWRHPFEPAEPLAWSPDGRWIAFFATDRRLFTNAWAVLSEGGEPRPLTRLANGSAGSLAWAPDGERFYLDSQHRTTTGQLLEVDLVPRTPPFREERFEALFREPAEPAAPPTPGARSGPRGAGTRPGGSAGGEGEGDSEPVPVRIDFQGIGERVRSLEVGVDAGVLALSPDGGTLVFTASAEGRTNLYAVPVDPEDDGARVARQLTATAGAKGRPWFTPDGREVVYLDGGRIRRVPVASGSDRPVAVTAALEVEVGALRMAAFRQGWRYLQEHFYDPRHHGVDWEAVGEAFAPRIAGARSDGEMARLMNLMVGELDASHLGYSPPGGGGNGAGGGRPPATGDLALRFDPAALEREGALVVAEVIPLGPGALAGVRRGDRLRALDGVDLAPGINLNRLLEGRTGDRVRVTLERSGEAVEVEARPVSQGQARQVAYRAWVASRRAFVDSVSGGRLGYVHMASMSWGAYQQLLVDLDAGNHAREGVVVDLRGNNGGFVNAYALDVFARQGYLTMEMRGYPETNARSVLGQRALEAPTVLVVDRNTLSDGEDFTEGYRALGLGRVVGEPTAGWIVFTWNLPLVDGATFRIPRSRIRGVMGDDMERAPRPVDVLVPRPPGETAAGRDAQLEVAVRALLAELDGGGG